MLGRVALTAIVLAGCAAFLFWAIHRLLIPRLVEPRADAATLALLDDSLADQKRLAELDPTAAVVYRQRFDELETTARRLKVLQHNRDHLARRYEAISLAVLAGSVLLVTGVYVLRHAAQEPRLAALRGSLVELAAGRHPVTVGDSGRDTIGQIAAMVEETSARMAEDQRRLAALSDLSRWQEAARRQTYELRTPLTSVRLELDRLRALAATSGDLDRDSLQRATETLTVEVKRLTDFTHRFSSFARLAAPRLELIDLRALVAGLVDDFAEAWPKIELRLDPGEAVWSPVDAEMMRRVLVNLCDNAAAARSGETGTVLFRVAADARRARVEVEDDGPGVPPTLAGNLFEPYVTSKPDGRGMGLGLAIARKIVLDHGGELGLVAAANPGATFRIELPLAEAPRS